MSYLAQPSKIYHDLWRQEYHDIASFLLNSTEKKHPKFFEIFNKKESLELIRNYIEQAKIIVQDSITLFSNDSYCNERVGKFLCKRLPSITEALNSWQEIKNYKDDIGFKYFQITIGSLIKNFPFDQSDIRKWEEIVRLDNQDSIKKKISEITVKLDINKSLKSALKYSILLDLTTAMKQLRKTKKEGSNKIIKRIFSNKVSVNNKNSFLRGLKILTELQFKAIQIDSPMLALKLKSYSNAINSSLNNSPQECQLLKVVGGKTFFMDASNCLVTILVNSKTSYQNMLKLIYPFEKAKIDAKEIENSEVRKKYFLNNFNQISCQKL